MFHEIKTLRLKKRNSSAKLERIEGIVEKEGQVRIKELGKGSVSESNECALWKFKKIKIMMLDYLQKNGEAIEIFKYKYDERFGEINLKMQKIETALKKIMENSEAMLRVSSTNMSAMVARLEKMHKERSFVDLEMDVGVSSSKDIPPSMRRTKQRTKVMEAPMPQDLLDLKEATNTMLILEKEATNSLNIFM